MLFALALVLGLDVKEEIDVGTGRKFGSIFHLLSSEKMNMRSVIFFQPPNMMIGRKKRGGGGGGGGVCGVYIEKKQR
jgi:hypothetical protein